MNQPSRWEEKMERRLSTQDNASLAKVTAMLGTQFRLAAMRDVAITVHWGAGRGTQL
jgi:predicted secreted protein